MLWNGRGGQLRPPLSNGPKIQDEPLEQLYYAPKKLAAWVALARA